MGVPREDREALSTLLTEYDSISQAFDLFELGEDGWPSAEAVCDEDTLHVYALVMQAHLNDLLAYGENDPEKLINEARQRLNVTSEAILGDGPVVVEGFIRFASLDGNGMLVGYATEEGQLTGYSCRGFAVMPEGAIIDPECGGEEISLGRAQIGYSIDMGVVVSRDDGPFGPYKLQPAAFVPIDTSRVWREDSYYMKRLKEVRALFAGDDLHIAAIDEATLEHPYDFNALDRIFKSIIDGSNSSNNSDPYDYLAYLHAITCWQTKPIEMLARRVIDISPPEDERVGLNRTVSIHGVAHSDTLSILEGVFEEFCLQIPEEGATDAESRLCIIVRVQQPDSSSISALKLVTASDIDRYALTAKS